MFVQIMRMEREKIMLRWSFWVGLCVALLPGILFLIIAFYIGRSVIPVKELVWPGGVVLMLAYANGYFAGTAYSVYLLAGVIGMALAQEYTWRTMQLWLSRGISRRLLLTCKFLIALLATLVVGVAYLLVGCIISLFLAMQSGGGIAFAWGDIVSVFLDMLRTTYGMLPYVALTFLLVILLRSPLAIVGVLIYIIGIELTCSLVLPLLGPAFASIPHYLPIGLAQEMTNLNYASVQIPLQVISGNGLADPLSATIGIALYTLVLFALALWLFQHQDLAN
jgi:ABC-type transport system involved in multi-copper enzyme maturation permease subunit